MNGFRKYDGVIAIPKKLTVERVIFIGPNRSLIRAELTREEFDEERRNALAPGHEHVSGVAKFHPDASRMELPPPAERGRRDATGRYTGELPAIPADCVYYYGVDKI